MSSTIPLLCIKHTTKCGHIFLHALLHLMELENFVALVFQHIIFVLSDVIEYHFPLYAGI